MATTTGLRQGGTNTTLAGRIAITYTEAELGSRQVSAMAAENQSTAAELSRALREALEEAELERI